jgi:hypothetical protein
LLKQKIHQTTFTLGGQSWNFLDHGFVEYLKSKKIIHFEAILNEPIAELNYRKNRALNIEELKLWS